MALLRLLPGPSVMISNSTKPGEFAFIAALAKQAAHTPEALGLGDDGAVLWLGDGRKLVLVADMLQAGVHTMKGASAAQIASKALRTNLSDLAAMGAEPAFYLSTICWPGAPDEHEMSILVETLENEQKQFNLSLIGGDTICGQGPLTISMTVLGWASGPLLRRVGAQIGDDVWVSGIIGDGWLGLGVAQGNITSLDTNDADYLLGRYEYPEPRLALGKRLAPLAHCALDVSDGLIADAKHLARAGDCCLHLDYEHIPLSNAARHWLSVQNNQKTAINALMENGDDYELLFTAAVDQGQRIDEISHDLGLDLTRIGRVIKGQGVMLGTPDGAVQPAKHSGFTHF